MAPEAISKQVYNERTDVYSLSIVFAEIFTRNLPYPDVTPVMVATGVITQGLRPELPAYVPPAIRSLTEAMWSGDPAARPALADVLKQVEAALKQ